MTSKPEANTIAAIDHVMVQYRLRKSDKGVELVAEDLALDGFEVIVRSDFKPCSYANRMKYVDQGDIEAYKDGKLHIVEAKQLTRDFTSLADWPFRTNFLVCAKHAWEAKVIKPRWFFIVNAAGTHAAILDTELSNPQNGHWTVCYRVDENLFRARQAPFWKASLSGVIFRPLKKSAAPAPPPDAPHFVHPAASTSAAR